MRKTLLPLLIGFSATPLAALAQFGGTSTSSSSSSSSSGGSSFVTTAPNPLPFTSIPEFLCRGAYALFWFSLPLAVLAVLIAAVLLITSSGNPQRLQRAKDALLFAIIGWVVVLLSGALGMVIANFLGAQPGGFGRC